MNLLKSRNDKTRFFTAVICFAAVFYLLANQTIACSWDYPIWQVRSKNADSLYRFVKGDKAGYINQKGHIVIKPTLDYLGNSGDEFVDGFLLAKVGEGSYLDKSGKVALETKYYRTWEFSEGLAVAMEKDNGKWGYMDKTGKFVIPPRFESYPNGYVYSFSDGLAKIEVKGKYGYIDRSGEFVIKPEFLEGTDFNEGFAVVVVEGPCVYVGEGPCEMFNAKTLGGENKYEKAPACKFTFIDKTGSIISAEKYDRAGSFSEGLASVMLNGKWGYIDKKGVMVIKPQFEQSQPFSDGLAAIKQGEKWGFIDKKGEIVINVSIG